MSTQPVNHPTDANVDAFVTALGNERLEADCRTLIELMRQVSGQEPRIWNPGTIGFGSFEYRYASGHGGVCQTIGFRPGTRQFSIYLMDGTARYEDELARLGRHRIGKACLYIPRLDQIDLTVLRDILARSYQHLSTGGQLHRG